MQRRIFRGLFALLFLGAALAQAADKNADTGVISGSYSGKPGSFSEYPLVAQGLGGVLLGDESFQKAKIQGTVDRIDIVARNNLWRVTAFDSASRVVAEGDVAVNTDARASDKFYLERTWTMFHEGKTSEGITKTEFSKDSSGSLLVRFTTRSKGSTKEVQSWLTYPSLTQTDGASNPASSGSAQKSSSGNNSASSLFGR
ncbi:MAG: hypothetical protein QM715_20770 [Nibricoccus sp.]